MTYVEFFDTVPPKNICACLSNMPERVVLVGFDAGAMSRHAELYKRLFAERGLSVEFVLKTAPRHDFDAAVKLIKEILREYPDASFDITGGEEMYLMALGAVFSENRDLDVHSFNLQSNRVCDCDRDGKTVYSAPPLLSVSENILIYGGTVRYSSPNGFSTFVWDMNQEFVSDIDKMWQVYTAHTRYWNFQTSILASLTEAGTASNDGREVSADFADIRPISGRTVNRGIVNRSFLNDLRKKGLVESFWLGKDSVSVTFKSRQVKKCLTKSGLALEMKMYSTARSLTDRKGDPVYNDSLNGVVIDWDDDGAMGGFDRYDTENEIDVMLMHGIVPVFVSCKNGSVGNDELYKLNTVATRFGGALAKKALVTTTLDTKTEFGRFFANRAREMGVKLIVRPQDMSDKQLKEVLSNLWK